MPGFSARGVDPGYEAALRAVAFFSLPVLEGAMSADAATGRPRRFRIRERFFDLGEDYSIQDEEGRPVYVVDGCVLALRKTFLLRDLSGQVRARIRAPLVSLRETVVIEREGLPRATVRRALFTLLRPRYHVESSDGDLEVIGDIIGREYSIRRRGMEAVRVSRRLFSIRETYGVEVAPGEDALLLLSIAVALQAFRPRE